MTYWLLYITSCLAYNYHKIVIRKKRPDYLTANIWRTFWGAVIWFKANPYLDPVGNPLTIWLATPFAVWQLTSFYLLFDPSLNLLRKKSMFYQGENSGWLDSLPKPVYYSLKALCLIGFLYTSFILL